MIPRRRDRRIPGFAFLRGLVGRRRRREIGCGEASAIAAWHPLGVTDEEARLLERHVATCAECRDLLEFASGLKARVDDSLAAHPRADALVRFAEGDPTQSAGEAAVVRRHLDACADCRGDAGRIREVAGFREVSGAREPDPPHAAAARPSQDHRPWRRRIPRFVPATATLFAAAFLLLDVVTGDRRVPFRLAQELPGAGLSDASWADFDGDGDLDLILSGLRDDGQRTLTYRNEGGRLVERQALLGLHATGSGSTAWGDCDGDGDADLVIAGMAADSSVATRLYRNDGAGLLSPDPAADIEPLGSASLAWGDADNDGDLDLLAMGWNGEPRTRLYRNDGRGRLEEDPPAGLPDLSDGSADWADWDGDGDLDLLLTGSSAGAFTNTHLLRNGPPGVLRDEGDHGLPPLTLSDAAWGDCDGDGDLDLALTGATQYNGPNIGGIFVNDGSGAFTRIATAGPLYRSSCAWCDYDGDGDLDAVFLGYTGATKHCVFVENTEDGFETSDPRLERLAEGSLSWADVDGDGRPDLFVTGQSFPERVARLYAGTSGRSNRPPEPPASLEARCDAGFVRLAWSGAHDAETPEAALCAVVRIGRTPGAHDVVSGIARDRLLGNVGTAKAWGFLLPPGTYYWSVRMVDPSQQTSAWAEEGTFRVPAPQG